MRDVFPFFHGVDRQTVIQSMGNDHTLPQFLSEFRGYRNTTLLIKCVFVFADKHKIVLWHVIGSRLVLGMKHCHRKHGNLNLFFADATSRNCESDFPLSPTCSHSIPPHPTLQHNYPQLTTQRVYRENKTTPAYTEVVSQKEIEDTIESQEFRTSAHRRETDSLPCHQLFFQRLLRQAETCWKSSRWVYLLLRFPQSGK